MLGERIHGRDHHRRTRNQEGKMFCFERMRSLVSTLSLRVQIQLQPDKDELMVLASDGLWDEVSSQYAINFVRRALCVHSDIQRAADELVSKALEKGSADNISVLVCCFAGP
jgi:protein phosphatase 2C family protein 2/3